MRGSGSSLKLFLRDFKALLLLNIFICQLNTLGLLSSLWMVFLQVKKKEGGDRVGEKASKKGKRTPTFSSLVEVMRMLQRQGEHTRFISKSFWHHLLKNCEALLFICTCFFSGHRNCLSFYSSISIVNRDAHSTIAPLTASSRHSNLEFCSSAQFSSIAVFVFHFPYF